MKLRNDRLVACKEYKQRHGKNVCALLAQSGWMSGFETSEEGAGEEAHEKHQEKLAIAAGLTTEEIEGGVEVWERVRPSWHSAEVRVFKQLSCEKD